MLLIIVLIVKSWLLAEIEHNLISMRTKEALAHRKSEGVRLGRPPGKGKQNVLLDTKTANMWTLISMKHWLWKKVFPNISTKLQNLCLQTIPNNKARITAAYLLSRYAAFLHCMSIIGPVDRF